MSDFLLEISRNASARRFVRALGLPLPLPENLARGAGAWEALPLADRAVVVGASERAELASPLAACLASAGADPFLAPSEALAGAFRAPGETFGRPAHALDALADSRKAHGLVFDASGLERVAELEQLHAFFHPLLGRLARSGRVVVLGRELDASASPERAAVQAALEGFVRSVAKEVGRGGATANLVRVARGAESRLGPVVRFLLSQRSAFVSAQPLVVTARARSVGEPTLVRSLDRKIALVTGAARGIGAATARQLAAEGATVLCLDRPGDDALLSQLARAIGGVALLVDLTADDAPARIAEALAAHGGVDVVVHNAGITRDKTLARMSVEQWRVAVDVNLGAVVRATSALEPQLRDGGRIVCLSSVAGLAGNVGQSNYAASKAGIVGFVRAEAERLADRGVTVNAIAPGFIETRLTAAIPVTIREAGRRLSALAQGGQPDDVAQAITFLATPGAQGITGRTLRVCGGALIGA